MGKGFTHMQAWWGKISLTCRRNGKRFHWHADTTGKGFTDMHTQWGKILLTCRHDRERFHWHADTMGKGFTDMQTRWGKVSLTCRHDWERFQWHAETMEKGFTDTQTQWGKVSKRADRLFSAAPSILKWCPAFRGHHSPGVRKHWQIIFTWYFQKSSINADALGFKHKHKILPFVTGPATNWELSYVGVVPVYSALLEPGWGLAFRTNRRLPGIPSDNNNSNK